ncbi:MAG: hypothetical protein AAGA16_14530 [Cyanobacteria bacterium P01_E01_bin.35]
MSDRNMDDLLAQLKNEFEPKQRTNPQAGKSPIPQAKPPHSAPQPSMEQMLSELSYELEFGTRPNRSSHQQTTPSALPVEPKQNPSNSAKYRQRLNALIDSDYQQQEQKREAQLAEKKRQEEAKIAEQQRRQQELIEAQQRAELREQRRKEALRETARQWLKNLNPRSEEGKWFEEFSYSYEDKLQAAIDYLEALRETGL